MNGNRIGETYCAYWVWSFVQLWLEYIERSSHKKVGTELDGPLWLLSPSDKVMLDRRLSEREEGFRHVPNMKS